MKLKSFLVVFLLTIFGFFYTIVYSSFYKNDLINFGGKIYDNLFLNSSTLNTQVVYFKSEEDISSYKISSTCNIASEFLYSKDNYYFFRFKIFDQNCSNNNFYLKDQKGIISNSVFDTKFVRDFDFYNKYTDLNDNLLTKAREKIINLKNKYKLFLKVDENNTNFDLVKKAKYYKELDYSQKIIENILIQRNSKYQIPIVGLELPLKNINKLPNGPRPYRASYTDGIHEGWDVDAPLGKEVVSIDSGIIVRVTRDFKFSDLSKIKQDGNLTLEDKVKNLDVLRGNQVWVKTMKGDVIFYSHLSKVYDDIQVGNIVSKGYPLGQVGKTGVPDKDYTDYHLHFELRKNPYLISQAGNNTLYDYMNWDWYFKGETREYIKENQYTIFQK